MTNYRRNFIPGGSFFFTVNLAERRLRLLAEPIDLLREAFRRVRRHYIHYNPVKHGHVRRVRDWPSSSFHRMVRLGIYPLDWAGDAADTTAEFGER